jgi:hypothetical protein
MSKFQTWNLLLGKEKQTEIWKKKFVFNPLGVEVNSNYSNNGKVKIYAYILNIRFRLVQSPEKIRLDFAS